jgi:hypothetical protein
MATPRDDRAREPACLEDDATAAVEIARKGAPGRPALTADVADRARHLPAGAAQADRRRHRDGHGRRVDPRLRGGAVDDRSVDVRLGAAARRRAHRAFLSSVTLRRARLTTSLARFG